MTRATPLRALKGRALRLVGHPCDLNADVERARPSYPGSRTYAFLTGCGRSGTTALTELVNRHPDVAIGYERFALIGSAGGLSPELFEPDRFRDFRDGDSHWRSYVNKPMRELVLHRCHAASVVGDKIPQLVERLDQLDAFSDPRVIFIVREPFAVAKSFESRAMNERDGWSSQRDFRMAVNEFNDAMDNILAYVARGRPYLLLDYDGLFLRREGLDDIWTFLGVDPGRLPSLDDIFSWKSGRTVANRSELLAREVSLNADFGALRQVLSLDRMRSRRENMKETAQ